MESRASSFDRSAHHRYRRRRRLLTMFTGVASCALAILLVTAGMGCGGGGTTGATATTDNTTTGAGAGETGLTLTGSWYTDDLTHQEPITVTGVTSNQPGTLFVTFIASDSGQGPERGGPPLDGSVQSVSGGGLTWTRQVTAHLSVTGEPGITEIWTAYATGPVAPFSVTVTRSNDSGANTYCDNWSGGSGPDTCNAMVYVQAIAGADPTTPIGATGYAGVGEESGRPGPLTVNLTTTRAGSWVEGVGSDWSDPAPRVLGPNQTMLHEDMSSPNQDSYWAQRITGAVPTPGPVSLGVTSPVDHDCNMAAVEIVPAG